MQIYLFQMILLAIGWIILFIPATGNAITPEEIVIIVNKTNPTSVEIGKYYSKKRSVPDINILYLRISDQEYCDRSYYNQKIASEVKEFIIRNDPVKLIRCLVTTHGIPLKVGPEEIGKEAQKRIAEIKDQQNKIRSDLKKLQESKGEENKIARLGEELKTLDKELIQLDRRDTSSSLDSELTLVLEEKYNLDRWILNPFFHGFHERADIQDKFKRVLMVSRLDGPDSLTIKRLIDNTIKAEREGVKGKAYFDARGSYVTGEGTAMALYDKSIGLAAKLFEKNGYQVIFDDKPALFGIGECPEAAFYCGWYSLGHYVNSFEWVPGAVGYHIASIECMTLHNRDSQVWCKRMLEEGISATLGPVDEPFVEAFPLPHEFFGALLTGRFSLVEAYFLTSRFLSWRMVLVGDPLYYPFKNKPAFDAPKEK